MQSVLVKLREKASEEIARDFITIWKCDSKVRSLSATTDDFIRLARLLSFQSSYAVTFERCSLKSSSCVIVSKLIARGFAMCV